MLRKNYYIDTVNNDCPDWDSKPMPSESLVRLSPLNLQSGAPPAKQSYADD